MAMLEPILMFFVFAARGIFGAAPSPTTGDAGELAAAAAVFGVPHAPGYPTWILLAKAFGHAVPLGSWGYRMNLFSVFCMSASLAVLCDALKRWGTTRWGRIVAIAILGFSPLWQDQSVVTEVFPVLVLAVSSLLWLGAAAGDRVLTLPVATAIGMVFGLGLGAHQTLILMLPALILLAQGRPGRMTTAFIGGFIGVCIGFSVHLIIPIRAWQHPPINWGNAVDFNAFMRLLLRKDYGTFALTVDGARNFGFEELVLQLTRFVRGLSSSMSSLGMALVILGCLTWKRSGLKPSVMMPLALIILTGPFFLAYGRPGFDAQTSGALSRFYLLPAMAAALFIAAGVSFIERTFNPFGGLIPGLVVVALLPGLLAASHRNDYLLYDYGRAILRGLPPKSIFVMDGGDDTFYSMSYLIYGEHRRPDLELYDRGGVVFPGGYGKDFRQLPRELKDLRRVTIESQWAQTGRLWYSTLNDAILPGYDLTPAGLLRLPQKQSVRPNPGGGHLETLAVRWSRDAVSRSYRDRSLAAFIPFQKGLHAFYDGNIKQGTYWLASAASVAPDALWINVTVPRVLALRGYALTQEQRWSDAAVVYQTLVDLEPSRAESAINLGISLERLGQWKYAERSLREAIRREPNSARTWSTLGAHFWARQMWADAADAFDSAAAINSQDAQSKHWANKARSKIK